MRRIAGLIMAVALLGIALVSLEISPISAFHLESLSPFKKLSRFHTTSGVSQLVVGNIPGGPPAVPIKLINPTPATQVAAALVYDRTNETKGIGEPEVFLGCVVRELTPHAAVGIASSSYPPRVDQLLNPLPSYTEVISVPKRPVTIWSFWGQKTLTLLADGLGILAQAGRTEAYLRLVHPWLFSLPENLPPDHPEQRQDAINCVCNALKHQGLAPWLFEGFGIICPVPAPVTDQQGGLPPDQMTPPLTPP